MLPENKLKRKVKNQDNIQDDIINNSLNDFTQALAVQASLGNVQLSQTDTIAKNNRYYLISNNRVNLTYMYVTHGIVQTLIDQPVDDAIKDITIKSDELDAENIQDLYNWMLKKEVIEKVKTVAKWARLYGGGGIVIDTGGEGNIGSQPLYYESIKKDSYLEFYAADLWELFMSNPNIYAEDKPYVPTIENEVPYMYYGVPLHTTRVIRCLGKTAPSFTRPLLRGWGMSEIEKLVRPINQYLKNQDVIFELLDEANVSSYGIKNFNQHIMTSAGISKILAGIQLMNQNKNYLNAVVHDSEDSFEQKQLQFSGLADMVTVNQKDFACSAKMPFSKLFGQSVTGMNGGEDDIENYNSMLEGEIRGKYDKVIVEMLKIGCQQCFGFIPEDLNIEYGSLRILNSEQEENVKDKQFARVLQMYERGILPNGANDVINLCNLGSLLPNKIPEKVNISYPVPPIETRTVREETKTDENNLQDEEKPQDNIKENAITKVLNLIRNGKKSN